MDKREAFTDLIQQHKGLIYKVAALYADNLHDREDMCQEIIYQLWKSYDSFENRSGIGTWMYRVAMNTAINFFKRHKRRLAVESTGREILDYAEPPDADMEERFKAMNDQIKELNLMERGIVMLYLEGRSYEEISEVIGISTSNVGTRLSRIRDKLQKGIAKTNSYGS